MPPKPAKPARPAKPAKPVAPRDLPRVRKGARGGPLRRMLDAATGARMTYGEPVRVGERTVIPVARLRISGGGGFGEGRGGEGEGTGGGGGGGGHLDATPVGFIEVGPDGARYVAIPDPDQLGRTLRAAAAALVTLSGAAALRRRGPAGLLGR